ncbi:hypothetical protein EIP91_006591, partial [Steccherinum ochraceum]
MSEHNPIGLSVEQPQQAPELSSPDVRDELAKCLNSRWSGKTMFSFKKSYDVAPIPALSLGGAGTIGLPLSDRDASAIKKHSKKKLVGKEARKGIWEMDAAQVSFNNPRWANWITEIVKDVCTAWDFKTDPSPPRCQLQKLVLYELGAGLLSHSSEEAPSGAFATLVVNLPCKFSGGTVHFSHGSLTASYDCSETSLFQATVLSWFHGVAQESKVISSGRRLTLVYNLIHSDTNVPSPTLAPLPNAEHVQRLRELLTSWKTAIDTRATIDDSENRAPEKIVFMLADKYAGPDLHKGLNALKDIDKDKVVVASLLAQELGFRTGMALLEYYQKGMRYRAWYQHEDYEEQYDSDYVNALEFDEHTVRKKRFKSLGMVDMDGRMVASALDATVQEENIPKNLPEAMMRAGHADQDYERENYDGEGGDLTRWYRNAVFVIWPPRSACSIRYGADIGAACTHLLTSSKKEPRPSTWDAMVIDFLLSRAAKHAVQVTKAVCAAATSWSNIALWLRAVKTCSKAGKGLAIFTDYESIRKAIAHFGFAEVRPGLDAMLRDDQSNPRRFGFLDNLETWMSEKDQTQRKKQVIPWIKSSRAAVFKSFRKPQPNEKQFWITLAAKHESGVRFIEDTVLPQIKSKVDYEYLQALASRISDCPEFEDTPEPRAQVATSIMTAAIFAAPLNRISQDTFYFDERHPSYQCAVVLLRACLDDFKDLLPLICRRIAGVDGFPEEEKTKQIVHVMVLVLRDIALHFEREKTTVPSGLNKFCAWTLEPYMSWICQKAFRLHTNVHDRVSKVVVAMMLPGGPELLFKYLSAHADLLNVYLARGFIEAIKSRSKSLLCEEGYTGPSQYVAIAALAKQY